MSSSLLGLLALISLVLVLAYRYRAGRHRPREPEGGPGSEGGGGEGSPTVSVYGQECTAVRTAGSGIYVAGNDVILMEDDTIRIDGRSFTVTRIGRTRDGRTDGALITGLRELP